ncbi:hypothetical protein B0H14DRAFT_3674664 [Mycena olivaceomarginata]|nr:hypothetical protein B0H14DRAFT_3674664 [Mycena olivaceomarginata]
MPLRRLSTALTDVFPATGVDFMHPLFSCLTNLELIATLTNSVWEEWKGLTLIPNVTHFAFLIGGSLTIFRGVLAACPALRVLVFLHWGFEGVGVSYEGIGLEPLSQDTRFVGMPAPPLSADWQIGARGGDDFWIRAEKSLLSESLVRLIQESHQLEILLHRLPSETMSNPKTFDAFVPSNFPDFLALAKIRPDYISFDALRSVPIDDAHKAATAYTENHLATSAFDHSLRTYYFALAVMHNGFSFRNSWGCPRSPLKSSRRGLYHACVMHDLGWTSHPDGLNHPARKMSFEIFGGIMAYDFLRAVDPTLDAEQVGDIVQSIMLHTPPNIPPGSPQLS